MRRKRDELSSVLYDCSWDAFALAVTCLNSEISLFELVPEHPVFSIYRRDRRRRRGGGLPLGVTKINSVLSY